MHIYFGFCSQTQENHLRCCKEFRIVSLSQWVVITECLTHAKHILTIQNQSLLELVIVIRISHCYYSIGCANFVSIDKGQLPPRKVSRRRTTNQSQSPKVRRHEYLEHTSLKVANLNTNHETAKCSNEIYINELVKFQLAWNVLAAKFECRFHVVVPSETRKLTP